MSGISLWAMTKMDNTVQLSLNKEEAELLLSLLRDIYGIPDVVATLEEIVKRLEALVGDKP